MNIFLLRLSPWLVAILAALASWWQWRAPTLYPGPLLVVIILYLLTVLALVWRSREWQQGLRLLLPTLLALGAIGFGHLLIETTLMRLVTTALFALLPLIVLQLGWSLLYQSSHYPHQGLVRLNMALIPVGLWYVIFTLHGLHVLVQIMPWLIAVVAYVYSLCFLWSTLSSWREERERRWLWASFLLAAHVVVLLMLLPTSMLVHGAVAAVLITWPVRLRFLSLQPKPSPRVMAFEVSALFSLWLAILFSARWA